MTASGTVHDNPDHSRLIKPLGSQVVRAAIARAPRADVANQPYQYIAGPSLAGFTRK